MCKLTFSQHQSCFIFCLLCETATLFMFILNRSSMKYKVLMVALEMQMHCNFRKWVNTKVLQKHRKQSRSWIKYKGNRKKLLQSQNKKGSVLGKDNVIKMSHIFLKLYFFLFNIWFIFYVLLYVKYGFDICKSLYSVLFNISMNYTENL